MKNAIILHGTSSTPESFWFPKIKEFLESKGYKVFVPNLPEPDAPNLDLQLPFVLNHGKFNEETIIIAHSAGCPLTLAVLQNIDVKIKKAILVAGFVKPIPNYTHPILLEEYDFEKIKKNVEQIYFINSDDDPWECNDKQGREMFDNIGGTQIILHKQGHMGSDAFNQPYKEFPLIEKLIEL